MNFLKIVGVILIMLFFGKVLVCYLIILILLNFDKFIFWVFLRLWGIIGIIIFIILFLL